jgi:hypothetical protein
MKQFIQLVMPLSMLMVFRITNAYTQYRRIAYPAGQGRG